MQKILLVLALMTSPAMAQMQQPANSAPDASMPGMSNMQMAGMGTPAQTGVGGSPLSEPGQSAFAAIAEVVRALEADPQTDWDSVDINTLREHLRDMDVVTIDSSAQADEIEGGMRFTITGGPGVAPSIARMTLGHALVMEGVDGWNYSATAISGGAILEVRVPEADRAKLRGLGFYGLLASGMHHQPHHWMMANGNGMGQ